MSDRDPVVVGVDGSEESSRAIRWAADLAARNDRALVVVHAWFPPLYGAPASESEVADEPAGGSATSRAECLVRHAVTVARQQQPGLEVSGRLAAATPLVALHRHGETAGALVVAGHDHGRFDAALIGSVALELAGHTRCPLVVVRGIVDREGPVVLGVDDSPRSEEAVEFAFLSAAKRGARLEAIRTWDYPAVLPSWPGEVSEIMSEIDVRTRGSLESALAAAHERWPQVEVEYTTVGGSAGRALLDASASAQLVVVGSRGRGGFRGLVLGSTSHALIHHADCPVAVVPHNRDLDGVDVDEEFEEEEIAL